MTHACRKLVVNLAKSTHVMSVCSATAAKTETEAKVEAPKDAKVEEPKDAKVEEPKDDAKDDVEDDVELGLALPTAYGRQRGSNCREVALQNVTRSAKEPGQAELAPLFALFLKEHLPRQHVSLRDVPKAMHWTMRGGGFECLMTYFCECQLPVLAILATPPEAPLLTRVLGAHPVALMQRDAGCPGFVYFSRGHCMSVLKDPAGTWWDVKQNKPQRVADARMVERLWRSGAGNVTLLSIPFVRRHVAAALADAAAEVPLLALRTGRMLLPVPTEPAARDILLAQEVFAAPRPLWPASMTAATIVLARRWLSGSA